MAPMPSKPMVSVLIGCLALGPGLASPGPGVVVRCGTDRFVVAHLEALHRYWTRPGLTRNAQAAPGRTTVADHDEDGVAVIEDRGDLVVSRNPFDLDGAAIRLSPNAAGGHDPARLALPLEPPGA